MENKLPYTTFAGFLLLMSALAFSQTRVPASPGEFPAQEVLAAADRCAFRTNRFE